MTTDLVSLSEFVDKASDYTLESKNTDRGLKMIYAYNNFLNTPICEEMFTGENPLFIDFVKCTQATALNNNIKNSFDNFGEDAFSVTVYRMAGKEYNQKERMTLVGVLRLKTKTGDITALLITFFVLSLKSEMVLILSEVIIIM